MESYVASLLASKLPFEPWVAAVAWAALFIANHWAARFTRMANQAQRAIDVEDWTALRHGLEPKYIVARIVYAALVFAFALLLGGPAYVFFAGGLLMTVAYALALNLQGALSARTLAVPGAVTGSVTFSTTAAFQHMAHRVTGGAVASLIAGLVFAHVALLGGAFLLAATALGYRRRARNASSRR